MQYQSYRHTRIWRFRASWPRVFTCNTTKDGRYGIGRWYSLYLDGIQSINKVSQSFWWTLYNRLPSPSEDNIMLCLCRLSDMLTPYGDFWSNVILVFTHADTSTVHLYRSHKVALKTKVGPGIKEHFNLDQELPMVFLSTQKHVCSYLKGSADCDCIIGNRYHADCRRRFFEQVWRRRNKPFLIDVQDEDIE